MSLNNNEVVAGKFFLLKGGLPKSLIREQVVVPTPSKFQPGASCKHIPAKRPTKHSSKWRRRCRRPPESVVGHLGAPALSRPPHSNTDNLWIGGRHDGYWAHWTGLWTSVTNIRPVEPVCHSFSSHIQEPGLGHVFHLTFQNDLYICAQVWLSSSTQSGPILYYWPTQRIVLLVSFESSVHLRSMYTMWAGYTQVSFTKCTSWHV